ncbi:hypothetical protein BGW42_000129 [Actinomortierella wolfii]|nr:hypothetical protein BGW42_000129 [Actinomortierella wolfii]
MVRVLHSITAALAMAALAMADMAAEFHWAFGDAAAVGCEKQLRGQYEDLSIYAVPADCTSLLQEGHRTLPATSITSNLLVLERQHLDGDDVPRDYLAWQARIRDEVIPALNRLSSGGSHEENGAYFQNDEEDDWSFTERRQRLLFHHHHRNRGGRFSKQCRLTLIDNTIGQGSLLPQQSVVDYRLVVGSNCAAEDIAPLLSELVPPNTEILPVRTEAGSIAAMTSLPQDHPIRIKSRKLKHRASLQKIVDSIDPKRMERDITWLSGEAEGSPFTTRHSTSPQSHQVAAWLLDQLEASGACDNVEFMYYNRRFGPNVLCTIRGTRHPEELVILGAHHDDRGSFLNPRAPGADDDGSGTGMVLAVSRAIAEFNVKFERTVILALFSGEEQGLFGSAAYARYLKQNGANVITMLQGDMLAYQKPGEPIQTAFPLRHHTPELTNLLVNVTELYVPETIVGFTGACCSDHQSFFESGFPATAFFERNGPIADPKYHNSADLVYREGYSFPELVANTKAMLASIFELANYKLPLSLYDDDEDEEW